MTMTNPPAVRTRRGGARRGSGCPGKLLVLTILFVMIAEVLIYVPSIANFRLNWLNDRLSAAYTAALVLDAAPSGMVPESLAQQMLDSIGARAVAMKMGQQRRLLAVADMPPAVDHDVRHAQRVLASRAIIDAFETLLSTRQRTSCASSGRRRWAASSSRSCSTKRRCARRCCASRSTSCCCRW